MQIFCMIRHICNSKHCVSKLWYRNDFLNTSPMIHDSLARPCRSCDVHDVTRPFTALPFMSRIVTISWTFLPPLAHDVIYGRPLDRHRYWPTQTARQTVVILYSVSCCASFARQWKHCWSPETQRRSCSLPTCLASVRSMWWLVTTYSRWTGRPIQTSWRISSASTPRAVHLTHWLGSTTHVHRSVPLASVPL